MMLSIGTNSAQGRFLRSSYHSFRNCEPPSGSCVSICSCSSRNSWICSVSCQFMKSRLRSARFSASSLTSPTMFVRTGPSGGNSSLIARDSKSMHASAITGWTTRDAPWNCAPPGASLPMPVRLRPSSYCLSRSLRASLSFSISSMYLSATLDSSHSGSSSAMLP